MNDPTINTLPLEGICASLCEAMDVAPPKGAGEPLDAFSDMTRRCGKVDRIFMYNPDAVAMWLWQKYGAWYTPVFRHTSLALPLRSVMPSVTPVCFGTMYTGLSPEEHGIRSYTKPVLRCDTIFDALIRAGKRPAIVSEQSASLSMIYLEREMDYFILPSVDACTAKALELIEEDKYDFILLYNGDYDETMHRHAPEGEASLECLKKNIDVFDRVAEKIKACWGGHKTLLGFAPDHGCHEIDGGLGSHGLDMPEDLNIMHFYGIVGR